MACCSCACKPFARVKYSLCQFRLLFNLQISSNSSSQLLICIQKCDLRLRQAYKTYHSATLCQRLCKQKTSGQLVIGQKNHLCVKKTWTSQHIQRAVQPLPCFCLHLGTQSTKLLKINTKNTSSSWRIFRLTVEWFLKTSDDLDGNGLLKTYVLSKEDKIAAGALGRDRNSSSSSSFFASISEATAHTLLHLTRQSCPMRISFASHNLRAR